MSDQTGNCMRLSKVLFSPHHAMGTHRTVEGGAGTFDCAVRAHRCLESILGWIPSTRMKLPIPPGSCDGSCLVWEGENSNLLKLPSAGSHQPLDKGSSHSKCLRDVP